VVAALATPEFAFQMLLAFPNPLLAFPIMEFVKLVKTILLESVIIILIMTNWTGVPAKGRRLCAKDAFFSPTLMTLTPAVE